MIKNQSITGLPSAGWAVFMMLPFAANYSFFPEHIRDFQGVFVLLFGAGLLMADIYAYRALKPNCPTSFKPEYKWPAFGMAGLFLVLSIFHLSTVESIPILSVFSNAEAVNTLRSAFSRDMDMPAIIRYGLSSMYLLLGLPAIYMLFLSRRWVACAIVFALLIFYTVAGTAKAYALISLITIAFMLLTVLPTHYARKMVLVGFAAMGVYLAVILALSSFHPKGMIHQAFTTTPKPAGHHIGDFNRDPAFASLKSDYVLYRVFMTPIEVSARWYEYFEKHPVSTIRFNRSVHDSRTDTIKHPAEMIGERFYWERFPTRYDDNVHAYASIDADAWARYGVMGAVLAFIGLMGMRVAVIWFDDTHCFTRGSYGIIITVALTLLPAMTSIQALLVAHGFATMICIMMIMWLIDIFRQKRTHEK